MNTLTQVTLQNDAPATPLGKLSVYFCGGAGANLSEKLKTALLKFNRNGMADMTSYVIDTSESNMHGTTRENTYIYKGLDGFGKKRNEDPAAIKKKIPEILANFEPQEFNIVVAGLAGGSGSVISPFIVRELISQGKSVVVLGVVSTDTETEIINTDTTLGNLETISQSTGVPVVIRTYLNPDNGKQGEVDDNVVLDVLKLAMLFSRRNTRLDQSDLRNWLHYNRVVEAPAKLVSLEMVSGADTEHARSMIEEGMIPIAAATVAPPDTSTRTPWPVRYQATGFVPVKNSGELTSALHFTIVDGQVAALHKKLNIEKNRLLASANGIAFAKPVSVTNDPLNDMFK